MDEDRKRDILRLQLRKARQMIDWRLLTIKEVLYVDVIEQVKAEGVTNQVEVERRAQRIWHEVCFPLDIYRTDQGTETTKAEFMCEWLQCGYSWGTCLTHLDSLSITTFPKRELSLAFKERAKKRLEDHNAFDEAEAEG